MIKNKDKFLTALGVCRGMLTRAYEFYTTDHFTDCEIMTKRAERKLQQLMKDHFKENPPLKRDK